NYVNSQIIRPFLESQWKTGEWLFTGALGLAYSGLSEQISAQPEVGIVRNLPHRQKMGLNTGLHHKLQPYQVLFASDANEGLDQIQSWKSTLTYEKNFQSSVLKATAFYENLDHIASDQTGFSALNILEEYPPAMLVAEGTGQNYGLEMAWQHYL